MMSKYVYKNPIVSQYILDIHLQAKEILLGLI